MPELPEVETIRRALQAHLPGKRIERVVIRDGRLRWPVDEDKLKNLVETHAIVDVQRRAKYLLLKLSKNNVLIIHLGMSGRLLYLHDDAEALHKHDHVLFFFTDGDELRFRDPRRFGMVDAVRAERLKRYARFANLGLEPLAAATTAQKLFSKAQNSRKPIKNLLMDAQFMVGVGNIYANESLFHAGIHPSTPTESLGLQEWQRLHRKIRAVLNKAIAKGGTTLNDFVDSNGETGYFQLSLAVYGRAGETCKKCKAVIERFVQVGRSTFFCPQCQKIDPLQQRQV
jgi:formamidopyrimidine-DNA glycosylase